MTINKSHILKTLESGFVSSCQPVDGGPMDQPSIVAAMAAASVAGGASGLRIEGTSNLKAVRPLVSVPIIGIIKYDLTDSDVRITPYIDDVIALKEAGADVIAIDATLRVRPTEVSALIEKIHELGCLAMADCSSYEECIEAHKLGADIIGTTMSGYVSGPIPHDPDLELVTRLSHLGFFVMAEGRYNSPTLAGMAINAGANCVTVGSAITRVEHICHWFDESVRNAATHRG